VGEYGAAGLLYDKRPLRASCSERAFGVSAGCGGGDGCVDGWGSARRRAPSSPALPHKLRGGGRRDVRRLDERHRAAPAGAPPPAPPRANCARRGENGGIRRDPGGTAVRGGGLRAVPAAVSTAWGGVGRPPQESVAARVSSPRQRQKAPPPARHRRAGLSVVAGYSLFPVPYSLQFNRHRSRAGSPSAHGRRRRPSRPRRGGRGSSPRRPGCGRSPPTDRSRRRPGC
jgi:hypothetical protein